MKLRTIVSSLVITLALFGCIGNAHYESVTKGYSLSAIDVMSDMTLNYKNDEGYSFSVVTSTVFAIGYDEDFIIVKQHPREFPNPPDNLITNYFIIPFKNKVSELPESNVIGPFAKNEFEGKREELGISDDLKFTKVIEELE
ncbi:MAG: hypothetical protein ABJF04_21540 [Reichenbachiella sp.]|uniref:hypothetical protein n=1 Tax=Reichenbachiella sp. TaxID=2184521 RepID=UPI003266BCFA